MKTEKTTTSDARLLSALAARRTPEQEDALARLGWRERLTSLWAPLITFALVFAPYVVLVEFSYQSHLWAQPALKWFGLAMVAWFAGLLIDRLSRPAKRKLRKLRVEAGELLAQLDRELRRNASASAPAKEKVVQQAAAVDAARISGDSALEAHLEKLGQVADKHLPGWRRRSTIDGVKGLAWTLLAVVVLRTLLVEPYKIPTGSMLPTVNLGDHVVVNRFIYGVRVPFMNVVPFPIVRRPRRGDVIVFNNPRDTRVDFIKRVVGVPGDTIEVRDEVVYVNGVAQPRELEQTDFVVWNREDEGEGPWYEEHRQLWREVLNGVPHAVLRAPEKPAGTREGPYVVPDGNVFVMGDNRDSSSDSRYGFGTRPWPAYVPYGNIKGKAMVIWLSLSHGGLLSGIFGGTGLRTDRLFTPIR